MTALYKILGTVFDASQLFVLLLPSRGCGVFSIPTQTMFYKMVRFYCQLETT